MFINFLLYSYFEEDFIGPLFKTLIKNNMMAKPILRFVIHLADSERFSFNEMLIHSSFQFLENEGDFGCSFLNPNDTTEKEEFLPTNEDGKAILDLVQIFF